MKKTSLVMAIAMFLFAIVVVSQTVSFAIANPGFWKWINYTTIDIVSPTKGECYPSNNTWLKFTVARTSEDVNITNCQIKFVAYCVDGICDGVADEKEIIVEVHDSLVAVDAPSSLSFSFRLAGLKEGQHTVDVLVGGIYDGGTFDQHYWGQTFFVDDGVPPKISLLSAENMTYWTANIPLTYLTNEQVVRVSYGLDGQYKSYLSGNTTLVGLSEGSHAVIVYAYDEAGNKVSEKVYFTVSSQLVRLILALAVSISATGLGFFVFLKRRRKDKKP